MLEGLLTSHTVPSRESKRVQMEQFLEIVFASTATLSLQQEARPIKLGAGHGRHVCEGWFTRGHAMIVIDAAIDQSRQKIFMLAQGYMPCAIYSYCKKSAQPGTQSMVYAGQQFNDPSARVDI